MIQADSAILIEASTGRVVYEKNPDEVRPPASMTKMMTCILGIERLAPHKLLTVSPFASATADSELTLQPAEQLEAEQLLHGMMLVSDNGAAVVLAQEMEGTVPLFAKAMNEKAREIGCEHTHFTNPNGLPNDAHVSTARDMAKIAAYCMKNKKFREIVSERRRTIYWSSPKGRWHEAENSNHLLKTYEGINGIKTGWTEAAGGCLAASAKRGAVELIAIVMHSPDVNVRFEDARKLLDYGFANVSMRRGINKDRVEKNVWVRGGVKASLAVGLEEDVDYPLLHGEQASHYTVEYDLPMVVDAGIKEGEKVGELVLKYDGKPVATMPVVARESVKRGFSILSFLLGLVTGFL